MNENQPEKKTPQNQTSLFWGQMGANCSSALVSPVEKISSGHSAKVTQVQSAPEYSRPIPRQLQMAFWGTPGTEHSGTSWLTAA